MKRTCVTTSAVGVWRETKEKRNNRHRHPNKKKNDTESSRRWKGGTRCKYTCICLTNRKKQPKRRNEWEREREGKKQFDERKTNGKVAHAHSDTHKREKKDENGEEGKTSDETLDQKRNHLAISDRGKIKDDQPPGGGGGRKKRGEQDKATHKF